MLKLLNVFQQLFVVRGFTDSIIGSIGISDLNNVAHHHHTIRRSQQTSLWLIKRRSPLFRSGHTRSVPSNNCRMHALSITWKCFMHQSTFVRGGTLCQPNPIPTPETHTHTKWSVRLSFDASCLFLTWGSCWTKCGVAGDLRSLMARNVTVCFRVNH